MANEVNANIRIDLDTSAAQASLRSLQSQISRFNQSVVQSNAQAVASQKSMLSTLTAQIGVSKQFTTSITGVESSVSKLQTAIDKNKLSMGEYFRYGAASSKNFSRIFRRENEEITRLATDRVKRLQTQYVALEQAHGGVTKSMAIRPMQLYGADTAIAIQRQQLFNKLLNDGSTSLVNFGKNTQWAGRQLMVGFTIPLTIFGATASKIFMDLEKEAINFKKVYGDIFTTDVEVQQNLDAVKELSKEFTKYGIAAKDTMALAGVAAQSGLRSEDLMAATTQATRLAVLGQMEQAESMQTVISMQTAFQQSNEELAESVDFLNIIENQTVLSLQDVAGAIPRVAPVIKGMGGDVKDLAVLLVAMREGGVSAAEGANALKNSLARLITPTSAAKKMAREFGIDLEKIVEVNKGEVLPTIMALANAMKGLEGIEQQKLLSTVFGKFQYARIGALFKNITDDSSQAARAMDLMGMSTEQLAETAESELAVVEESVSTKFTGALERAKLAIAPIGETFLKLATPLLEGVTKLFDKFNELSPTAKNFVTILAVGLGVVTPVVLMLIGLFANFAGNAIKGVALMNNFFTRLKYGRDAVEYLSGSQLDAAAAASSLEGRTTSLTGSLNLQRDAVLNLAGAYRSYIGSAQAATASLPTGFGGARRQGNGQPIRMAAGGLVPGTGNSDSVPALLMPGESVITKEATQKFAPILQAMNDGSLQGFARGTVNISGQSGEILKSLTGDFFRSSVIEGIQSELQKVFNSLIEGGMGVSEALNTVETTFNTASTSLAEQGRKISKASAAPFFEGVGGGFGGERRYNASSAGERRSIDVQLQQERGAEGLAEYERAAQAAQASQRAILEYTESEVQIATQRGATEKELEKIRADGVRRATAASQVDRAHIVELSNEQKTFYDSWHSSMWEAQSGAENQMSNILALSDKNREQYSRYLVGLSDDVASEQQKQEILRKVTSNIALTEDELQIQAEALRQMLAQSENLKSSLSPGFLPFAAGAVGAADYRQSGSAGAQAARSALDASARVAQISSPSEAARKQGMQIDQGMAQGIIQNIPMVTAATQQMTGEVFEQLDLLNMKVEENVQGELFDAAQFAGPRRLAERDPIPRAQYIGGEGGSGGRPPSTGAWWGSGPDPAKPVVNNLKKTNTKISKMGDMSKKFGNALQKGSLKLSATTMGLSGLTFGLSNLEGSVGDMARKIMPATFGLTAIQQMLPLLTTPWGALIAGTVALGAGLFYMDQKRKEAQKNLIQMSISAQGSAKAFDELSKELGGIKPSQRFATLVSGASTQKEQESLTEGQQFLESESGKSMIGRYEKLAGAKRKEAIERELTQSLALQIITPEQAKGVARALALSFNDPVLGQTLISSISRFVMRSGKDVTAAVASILETTAADIDSVFSSFETGVSLIEEMNELLRRRGATTAFGTPEDTVDSETGEIIKKLTDAENERLEQLLAMSETDLGGQITASIGPAINASKKLAEAQSLINVEYRNGKIDLDQYTTSMTALQAQTTRLKDLFMSLQESDISVTDSRFSENLKDAALALGMSEEYINQMETQARALERILLSDFGMDETKAKAASNALQLSLTSGAIDPATAGLLPELMKNEQYRTVIDFTIDEDVTRLPEVVKLLGQVDMMPDPMKTNILTQWKSNEWSSPEDFTTWVNKTLIDTSYFAENPTLQMQVYMKLNEDPPQFTTSMAKKLEDFYKQAEQEIGVNLDIRGLPDLQAAHGWYKKIQKEKDLKKVLDVVGNWQGAFKAFGLTYDRFSKLPDVTKSIIMNYVTVYETRREGMAQARTTASTSQDPESRRLANQYLNRQTDAENEMLGNVEGILAGDDDYTPGADDKKDTGGGGSAEKSFLEQLLLGIDSNAKLYLNLEKGMKGYLKNRGKFVGLFQKLRGKGISEEIIESLGTGPEALKKASELLKLGEKARNKLVKDMEKISVGQAVENLRRKQAEEQQKISATKNIQGMDEDQRSIIMADEALVKAFATTKKGTPEYEKLERQVRRLAQAKRDLKAASESEEEAQVSANEAIIKSLQVEMKLMEQRANDDFAKQTGRSVDAAKELIAANEFKIKQLQREIDELEKLNKVDQDRIDNLERQKTMLQRQQEVIERQIEAYERQKEMIQRQIEASERANEMDQRRIEPLRRQEEMRGRVADAINYELEIMSQQEEKIRETHDKRIQGLDKIEKVNERIVKQQQQQLGLSQAISEGDIYAATAAAQEMRAQAAADAREMLREGMEESVERQVSGLTTPGGLTREQAEEQLRIIKQQSYQTSLQIQQIEDQIYERTQAMIPLRDEIYQIDLKIRDENDKMIPIKDQIRSLDDQILVINDSIYARNLLIKEVMDSKIAPLQSENSELQWNLTQLDERIRRESEQHRERVAQLERQNDFHRAAFDLATNLRDMTDKARQKADDLAGSWREVAGAARAAALAMGGGSVGAYAGGLMKYGMGGKVKKYAVGGVAGDGGRDSISAMLTPGEFVVRKSMVEKYGIPMMESINQGSFSTPRYSVPSETSSNVQVNNNVSNVSVPVYNNYDMKFSISGTNASADEIANKVMFKMKQIQSQTIRSNRG